jgi:hypothetical protein
MTYKGKTLNKFKSQRGQDFITAQQSRMEKRNRTSKKVTEWGE